MHRSAIAVLAWLALAPGVQAGLYFSGETFAELPSQWRGFLVDQRALRMIAVEPMLGQPASPLRQEYREGLARLQKKASEQKLSADELADLGALHVRLGQPAKAVELLRPAQREHPEHFRINANLGTAWQLAGDLDQAAICLEQSAKLAPGKFEKAEQLHLKLVRLRKRQPKDAQQPDDLFGVRFVDDQGGYTPGRLGAAEAKKLPGNAAALVQQLALWQPADGRLLWLLGELASAHGDIKLTAAIFDGCVAEFGMSHPELRRRRQLARTAAAALDADPPDVKIAHAGHAGPLKPRSRRPLLGRLDLADLPPISADGINAVPWAVLAETVVERDFKPQFSKYLKELAGKKISMSGYMQPLRAGSEASAFMFIEYPIGCWYCETPDITGIILVELPPGQDAAVTRGLIKVTGTLVLNATDPESFMYTLKKAAVSGAD